MDWISANNFAANARWQTGALYNKRHGAIVGDTYIVQDCTNSSSVVHTTTAMITPCQTGGTLDNFFPVILLSSNDHPSEIDLSTDGTITTIQGVRMWVANSPIPLDLSVTQSYRIYYEMNGKVYMGILETDGTPFRYEQADGSVVDYYIGFNQAAVNSIQQGLITGAVVAGSQAGSSAEVTTVDLFGIGGHGVNGALAPADLLVHYGIPTDLNGSGQTIAIVDAPGTGDVVDDLNVFSQYYNLPQCNNANPCFEHIDLSNGAAVSATDDWGAEVALDTQMVHAFAPDSKIILVTANSQSSSDLFSAINYAAGLPGVTAVTMSFSYYNVSQTDTQNENSLLSGFQSNNGLVFFASSGDAGNYNYYGVSYPAEFSLHNGGWGYAHKFSVVDFSHAKRGGVGVFRGRIQFTHIDTKLAVVVSQQHRLAHHRRNALAA